MTPRPVSGAVADADSRAVAGTVSRAVTIAVVAAAALFPAPAWSAGSLQRFALVVGANAGGADRPQLQYAISDAERFGRVLVELGGVAPAHTVVLRQPKLRDCSGCWSGGRVQLERGLKRLDGALGILIFGVNLPFQESRVR